MLGARSDRLRTTRWPLGRWVAPLVTAALVTWTVAGGAEEGARRGPLRIVTHGHPSSDGVALLALCRSPEEFARKGGGSRFAKARPVRGRAEFLLTDVDAGEYAIKVFQDVNDNRELDMGLFGPEEAYGFSNDAAATFGPPSWEDARFLFDGAERTVEIAMR